MKKTFLQKLQMVSLGSAMADMALLLLVFFMVTTTTEPPKGVEVEMPKAETKGAEQDTIYITIAKDGKLYYDGNEIALNDFYDVLSQRQMEKDRTVSITADSNLDYRKIQEVLNVLQDADFLNVMFMAEQRK